MKSNFKGGSKVWTSVPTSAHFTARGACTVFSPIIMPSTFSMACGDPRCIETTRSRWAKKGPERRRQNVVTKRKHLPCHVDLDDMQQGETNNFSCGALTTKDRVCSSACVLSPLTSCWRYN